MKILARGNRSLGCAPGTLVEAGTRRRHGLREQPPEDAGGLRRGAHAARGRAEDPARRARARRRGDLGIRAQARWRDAPAGEVPRHAQGDGRRLALRAAAFPEKPRAGGREHPPLPGAHQAEGARADAEPRRRPARGGIPAAGARRPLRARRPRRVSVLAADDGHPGAGRRRGRDRRGHALPAGRDRLAGDARRRARGGADRSLSHQRRARRSPRSPTGRRPSAAWTRSSAPETFSSRSPSARCTAKSPSTCSPGRARC